MPLQTLSLPQLPPLHDFLLSPGFAGILFALGATTVIPVLLGASRRRLNTQLSQQDRHHQQLRSEDRRRDTIASCWERLTWLIRTAGTEAPVADAEETPLGLGPELTLAILEGLNSQVKELDDPALSQAVAVYLTQYGLVLADRLGELPDGVPAPNGSPHDSSCTENTSESVDDEGQVSAVASTSQGRHR